MIRLTVVGLSALFLVACNKADSAAPNTPPANAVATDTSVTLELGEKI